MLTTALRRVLLSKRPTVAAQAAHASWPLTGMGAETDWSLTGDTSWNGVSSSLTFANDPGGAASLTGSAQTSFNAAVSNSTACTVTITISGWNGGTVEVRMKGGSWIDMTVNDDGPFAKTITSGAGSGFDIRSVDGADLQITNVQIALA